MCERVVLVHPETASRRAAQSGEGAGIGEGMCLHAFVDNCTTKVLS